MKFSFFLEYAAGESDPINFSGPPTIELLESMGRNFILNYGDHPVKATIKKEIGDEKYNVRLGDERSKS